jgi:type IV fimbrial biogenesis protein FimT
VLPEQSIMNKGFTLLELMLTVAIAAILSTIAAPYFRDLVLNNQISSYTNNLVQAAYAARIEAIKRTEQVRVSPINSSSSTNEWGPGLVVYVDLNTPPNDVFDQGTDEEIRTFGGVQGNQTIDETADVTGFEFQPDGSVSPPVTFRICDARTEEEGRSVTITQRGQIKTSSISCS